MADTYDHQGHDGQDGARESGEAFWPDLPSLRRPRRRGRVRRACLAVSAFLASVVFIGLIGAGLLFARLSHGPIPLDLVPQIKAALNERIGHGYAFMLGGTAVEATEHGPALTISSLSVVDGANRPIVSAPHAAIAIDPLGLLAGRISPRQLEIHDVDLHLLVLADGQVAVSTGGDTAAVPLARAFEGSAPPLPSGAFVPDAGPGPAPVAGAGHPPYDASPTASIDADAAAPANAALRALAATMRTLVDAATLPEAALGTFDTVNLTGRLVLDDRTHGTTRLFSNTRLSFRKASDGSAILEVAADGAMGRWSMAARASRADDGSKALTVEVHDLSLDEITLAGGLRDLGFDFDMPVSASASVRIAPDGTIDQATGRFSLGAGYFKLDDPDHEPLMIDAISGGFHLDTRTRALAIDTTDLKAGESSFSLSGRVDMPRAAGEPWIIKTQASGTFGSERPGEKPIRIARAVMAFRLVPADHKLIIDRVEVTGPEVAFESSGDLRIEGGSVRLNNTSAVRRMPARTLVRLWPSFIAAPVRAWFLANLRGGTVESGKAVVSLTEKDLALMRQQRSVTDDHLRVDYAVSGMDLNVLSGLPPLANVDGTGVVTGNTSTFTATHGELDAAPGRKLTLLDGTFRAPDTDPKPVPAVIDAHVAGSLDTLGDILGRDAIKPYASVPLDTSTVHGQVDGHLTIALKLGDHVPQDDAKVTASATISALAADKLIGKEGLTDGSLQITVDRTGVRAKGEGQIYGAPATIDLRKPAGSGPAEALVTLVLDNAARARAGLNLGRQLNGPVSARIAATLAQGDRRQASIDLDFAKASIDGLVPGFSKAAGRPGKASLTVVQHEGGTALDNIVFEGGGVALRGSADLDANGGFAGAKLSQVKLSPGDDLKLEATQAGDTLRIVARGANFDARPFLKWLGLSGSDGGQGGDGPTRNLDVELHAGVLTGQNSQAVSNADLRVVGRGGQIRTLQMTGRFGRQPLTIGTLQQGGAPLIVVRSADAGSCLAFMDLYKRMAGGRLEANLSFGKDRMNGYATIHDFALKEDPAIKKLATEGLASQNRSGDLGGSLDTSSMSFTKLEARFNKSGGRVTVEDGALFGPQVGATVKGTLDLNRDQVNLQGTFVPLYGLNNLFSQVPLFGPILGGGKHEGLLGINYRITGSPSQPVMSINPLTAMAPGFLRQIFGAIDSAAQGVGTAPGGAGPRDRAAGPTPLSPFEAGQ